MDDKTLECYITQVAPLTNEELVLIQGCTAKRQLKRGEAVLQQGETCHVFYLVEKGHLRTYYNKDGVAINLSFSFEGDFTCNLKSYRDRLPSEYVIEAGEDTSVWIFNLRAITGKIDEHSQIRRLVRRLALNLLMASEAHSDLFKIYTPTERYRYIEKNNPRLLQRISLSQIASYLGVTRETLSRIRAKN